MTRDPRPASTMCVLHEGESGLEVLMVRRGATARFMAGTWVFPGGMVDPADHDGAALALIDGLAQPHLGPWLAAAFREVVEETGVWLTAAPFVAEPGELGVYAAARLREVCFAGDRTAYFANWITPTAMPQRFDSRFFMAEIDDRVVPIPDGDEIDAAEFVLPAEALRRADSGEWLIPFPTQRTLQQIANFPSARAALQQWRDRPVVPVEPRMRVAADGSLEVLMPGDPGFADLADTAPDPGILRQAAAVAAGNGRAVAEGLP